VQAGKAAAESTSPANLVHAFAVVCPDGTLLDVKTEHQVLGRGIGGIRSKKVSREQARVIVNFAAGTAELEVLGKNPGATRSMVGRRKVKLVETSVESAWFQRWKLKYDKLLSSVAFSFNLRRYTMGAQGDWMQLSRGVRRSLATGDEFLLLTADANVPEGDSVDEARTQVFTLRITSSPL
jgi:hypothetical protein